MRTQEQIRNDIIIQRHAIFEHEQRIRELEKELNQAKNPQHDAEEAEKLREQLKAFMQ